MVKSQVFGYNTMPDFLPLRWNTMIINNELLDELKRNADGINQFYNVAKEDYRRMVQPVAFTINFHPTIRRKKVKRFRQVKLSLPIIEEFQNHLNGELRHLNYFSSERKKKTSTILAFGNLDYGPDKNLFHMHGVIDNRYGADNHIFMYAIKKCFSSANILTPIMSGTADIDIKPDIKWVRYCFKENNLCRPYFVR